MDPYHSTKSYDPKIILLIDTDFESKIYSYGHQFQKMILILFCIFLYQVDVLNYILPINMNKLNKMSK